MTLNVPNVEPLIVQDGLMIQPGLQSNLIISQTVVYKQPTPYSECVMDNTKEAMLAIDKYNTTTIQNALGEKDSVYTNAKCLLSCPECYKECPMECDTTMLDVDIHSAAYPMPYYAASMQRNSNFTWRYSRGANVSFEKLKSSLLALNVYHGSSNYQIIRESPALTFGVALSNLGGALGLFVG